MPSNHSSIVFVHGLASNPDTTWCGTGPSGKVNWIKDFLAPDLADAAPEQAIELWQYNYNSFWWRQASHYSLTEYGTDLCEALETLVSQTSDRSIVDIVNIIDRKEEYCSSVIAMEA